MRFCLFSTTFTSLNALSVVALKTRIAQVAKDKGLFVVDKYNDTQELDKRGSLGVYILESSRR